MKLATVLHSLGLTGSVLDFSKTIFSVDTYIAKETPVAKSRLLANIGPDGDKSHGALVFVISYTPDVSFSFHITLPPGGHRDRQPKH